MMKFGYYVLLILALSASSTLAFLHNNSGVSSKICDSLPGSVNSANEVADLGELQYVNLNYYYHDSIYNYLHIEASKGFVIVGSGPNSDTLTLAPTVRDTLWRLLTNIYANNLTEDIAKNRDKNQNKKKDCSLLMMFAPKDGGKKSSLIALEQYNDHRIRELHPDIIRTLGLMHVKCSKDYSNTSPSEFCNMIAPYDVKDFHSLGISERAPSLTSIGVDSIHVSLLSNMKRYEATLSADKSYSRTSYKYDNPQYKTAMVREMRDTLLTLINQMFVAKTVSPVSNVKRVDNEIVIDGPAESLTLTLYHNGHSQKIRQSIGYIDEQTVSTPSAEMKSLMKFLKAGCDSALLMQ